jgi:hypothetical protein
VRCPQCLVGMPWLRSRLGRPSHGAAAGRPADRHAPRGARQCAPCVLTAGTACRARGRTTDMCSGASHGRTCTPTRPSRPSVQAAGISAQQENFQDGSSDANVRDAVSVTVAIAACLASRTAAAAAVRRSWRPPTSLSLPHHAVAVTAKCWTQRAGASRHWRAALPHDV